MPDRTATTDRPIATPSGPDRLPTPLRDPWLWLIVGAGAALWGAGYPQPHIDDLFYSGAPIHLSQTGELANPWIAPWLRSLGTEHHFAQPPGQPYLLGLWLKIFGVSTATLTGFQLILETGLGVILYGLARAHQLSRTSALAIAVVPLINLIGLGLRPEPLAFFLLACGQLCLRSETPAGWFGSAVLVSGAVLTHPMSMTMAVPLHAARIWRRWRDRQPLGSFGLWTIAGIAVAAIAFLVAIGGELAEFLRVMGRYSQMFRPPWTDAPAYFWGEMTVGKHGLLHAAAAVIVLPSLWRAFYKPAFQLQLSPIRMLWIVWAVATCAGILLYPTRMVNYSVPLALLLAIATWGRSRWAPLVACAACAVTVASNAGLILRPAFGSPDRPDAAAVRQLVANSPQKTLCLDEVVARFVYDFRPPAHTIDWTQRQAASLGAFGTVAAKPASELWLVNEWRFEHCIRDSHLSAERLKIGGREFQSIAAAPHRIVMIP